MRRPRGEASKHEAGNRRGWAGLANGDLEAVCGIESASFCRNGRFIAATRTREAALAMAELAVKEARSIGA